jgi:hypothetical protein
MPLTYFQPSQVDSSFNGYLRNRIINGAMMIDQRNSGASISITGSAAFPVDRWFGINSTDGTMTGRQSAVVPASGYKNSVVFTTGTADASLAATQFAVVGQSIEGLNVSDLNWGSATASTVTLSFWVRSSLTGTFGGSVRNSAADRSYPFSYTITGANAWEQKFITIPGDTSGTWLTTNGIGISVFFGMGVGSTYSGPAGVWAGTNYLSVTGATSVIGTAGATFYITGVQLEDGAVATPFERRMYPQELAMCQRYYAKTYNTETTPGTATTTGYIITTTNASGWAYVTWNFAVAMRASPTITAYNHSTGATGTWQDGGGTARAVTVVGAGSSNVSFGSTASNLNSWLAGHAIASAEL